MNFPDLEEITGQASSEYEREFLRAEFAPGLNYYLDRIDRLLFAGDRVLDAGCGAGQWSMALAQRFRQVDAIDLKPERLETLKAVARRMGVGNVEARSGSVEELPYPEATFDAAFCYGVIMFTQIDRALGELHRVLRPGARLYVCLNADGWSRRLAEGPLQNSPLPRAGEGQGVRAGDPTPVPRQSCVDVWHSRPRLCEMPCTAEGGCATWDHRFIHQSMPDGAPGRPIEDQVQAIRDAGLQTLYTTYCQRAVGQGLVDAIVEGAKDFPEGLLPWEERFLFKVQRRIVRLGRRAMAALGGIDWQRSVARDCLCRSSVGRELLRRVRGFCGDEFVPFLLDDVASLLRTHALPCRFGVTRAFRPEEFAELTERAGFADFQWSVEAGLTCDWLKPASPKYPGYHGDELCVWECLVTKPDRACVPVSPQRHFEAAAQAAATPVYGEIAAGPVLSNASLRTFPGPQLAHARWLGGILGGDAYLKQLARTIVDGATGEEEAARRLIRFVQRAVFRDPVAQPREDDGSLPDALTALLCARGRCGHTARILAALFEHAGFEARVRQLPQHLVVEANCGGRWVLADADAFKNGIVPEGPDGRLLTMDAIEANPYLLDRFPPTGWMIRPNSRHTRGLLGRRVRGYVDALEPDRRGFVSGYYVPSARGFPPSLPEILGFEIREGRFALSWRPSSVREGRLVGYRVRVGTRSRGWTYDDVFLAGAPLPSTSCDVLETETSATSIEGPAPASGTRLFACVTAVSDRIDREPGTFFWPSEEAGLGVGGGTAEGGCATVRMEGGCATVRMEGGCATAGAADSGGGRP